MVHTTNLLQSYAKSQMAHNCFTAQVLKVCRTPDPIACSKTKMLHLDKVYLTKLRKEKKFHDWT